MDRAATQRQWYQQYRKRVGATRNDLRVNPGVLYQVLALEAAVVRAMALARHDPGSAEVLDVGCGNGEDFHLLLRLGYNPIHISGIDIREERLVAARSLFPQVNLLNADATQMDFEDNAFDLVFESTMFATLPVEAERSRIASEMVRVCRPGGYMLLVDWRTPRPGNSSYKALTKTEMSRLFGVGTKTALLKTCPGALIPPVGRFLSGRASSFYFLAGSLFPFLVGQVAYLLQKQERGDSVHKAIPLVAA